MLWPTLRLKKRVLGEVDLCSVTILLPNFRRPCRPALCKLTLWSWLFLVAGGTLFDIVHKGSAKYFFDNWRDPKSKAKRRRKVGEMMSIAVQTAVVDVMASGEFCNARRRIAHLLTMYGFVIYVVTTVVMVFAYPTPATADASALAHAAGSIGALMVCSRRLLVLVFIRVDVAAEGNSPFRFVRADLFIVTLAARQRRVWLIWAWLLAAAARVWATVSSALYLIDTTVLFAIDPVVEVLAHVLQAGRGAREASIEGQWFTAQNLPTLTRDDPEQQKRHSMELLRNAPMHMGLGIKREAPRHY